MMNLMRKILLTGGAGFIGSHTCVELCDAGYDPIIVDNYINSSPESIRRIEQIVGRPVPHYEADVADKAALDRIFTENDIGCVIHFAGLKAVGESVSQPLRYYRNNLDTTLTLCETMQAHGVKSIVFSSSATVYGNQPVVPYREDMPSVGCTNPYGWTKFMIEKILEGQTVADPSWSVVLLRYFNPIGAHSSGLIGEDPSGDGTGVRDYIHVVDLAKGHVKACEYAVSHAGSEIINLGTGHGYSVLDLVNTFIRVNGVPVPYEFAPRRAGDIAENYADPSKAKELLGWEAERNLEDMCRDTYRFQQQNPDGYRTAE